MCSCSWRLTRDDRRRKEIVFILFHCTFFCWGPWLAVSFGKNKRKGKKTGLQRHYMLSAPLFFLLCTIACSPVLKFTKGRGYVSGQARLFHLTPSFLPSITFLSSWTLWILLFPFVMVTLSKMINFQKRQNFNQFFRLWCFCVLKQ